MTHQSAPVSDRPNCFFFAVRHYNEDINRRLGKTGVVEGVQRTLLFLFSKVIADSKYFKHISIILQKKSKTFQKIGVDGVDSVHGVDGVDWGRWVRWVRWG